MNSVVSFFSSPTAEVIARTVLHSFWQSAAILVVLLFILRITPERHSKVRYFFAYASLFLLLMTSGYTLINGWRKTSAIENVRSQEMVIDKSVIAIESEIPAESVMERINAVMPSLAPYIAMVWTLGVCLFLFRLSGSWWYLYRIRSRARILSDDAADSLNRLAGKLRVSRTVLLAESVSIHTPMVIGFLKPMLLIPVGFVAGLSTDQVEAIFIHELTHIKREDYLLNLVQSLAEAVFFFNPFVWIISSIIRREREHCCDDAVLRSGGNALAYVRALAHLEEHRLTQNTLALSAIGTKNELLHRIKRIMEKSVTKNSFQGKLIPGILLIIGIVCASWITISSTENSKRSEDMNSNFVAADTVIKKKNSRSATYSKKRMITTDADGKPQEEIVENFSGDEDLKPVIADMDFAHQFAMPPIPVMPNFDVMIPPHFDGFAFYADSLPRRGMHNAEQWKEFQEQFQQRFQEQFGDFYMKNQEQITKMLEDIQPEFQAHFDEHFAFHMEDLARLGEDNARLHEEHLRMNEEALREQEVHMREMEREMKEWEVKHGEEMKKLDAQLKVLDENMKGFEKELTKALRKDGYLKENETLRNMNWSDDGEIEINGVKIKPEDARKYRAIQKKYFEGGPHGIRFEN